jgi:geranylgeranylglycerol-phosphate geranylgeranyltransferase
MTGIDEKRPSFGSKLHAGTALVRLSTAGLAGLGGVAGLIVAAGRKVTTSILLDVCLCFLVVFCSVGAGNTLNDYLDIEVDRINRPDRTLPRGALSPRVALAIAISLFAIAIAGAIFLPRVALAIVILAIAIQMCYEFAAKKLKSVGNVVIAGQTGLLFLFGGSIVGNLTPVLFFSTLSFLSILGREVAKDISDVEGDVDRKTIPRTYGLPFARGISASMVLGAVLLSPIPFFLSGIVSITYLEIVAVADAIFLYSVIVLFQGTPRRPESLMKYGMLIALIAFIVGRFI